MVGSPRQFYDFGSYLELEAENPTTKHEFLGGHVWAMAGRSPDHARIAMNIGVLLAQRWSVAHVRSSAPIFGSA